MGNGLNLSESAEEIFNALTELVREGGPGSYLIVSSGDIYVQFSGSAGSREVQCEAISNAYLPDKLQITPEKIQKLEGMGFVLGGDGSNNFSQICAVSQEYQLRKLAQMTVNILETVYGLPRDAQVHVELSLE